MNGITANAGVSGSLYQAPQNPMLVEGSPAEEKAESTVKRFAEAAAQASGAASKAASTAHAGSVDTYA
jgi:hypothetical protein